MAEENYQKIKLLKIMEILRQETDEEHPMTKVELASRLVAMNVSCSPRSLIRDIKLLNEQGYEIMERLMGHEKGYFVCDRSFSVPELKILIDAVQAASFVTDKKTGELVGKIAALGGSHRAGILKGNLVKFNTRKHRNETVYYTVDYLEDAIKQNRNGAKEHEGGNMSSQVKSKERVAVHGEVFTADREVRAMCDLVKQETERIDSRFLEPACGDGNFLAEILKRKLAIVKKKYRRSAYDWERYSLLAIGSMYRVDIMQDNCVACRERLFQI